MTSQPSYQTIAIHILTNISGSKGLSVAKNCVRPESASLS